MFSDILATLTDVVGGRSATYESKLQIARDLALDQMAKRAKEGGANAVVGVRIDYEIPRGSMLMVVVSGTAVMVEPE